ncbi:ATP-binding protein [Microbacterium sp. P07]|uniref:ATP-binding protein n=1 Tax=Microbacterium sp. P07 TaxID=3366952 RepID=UPI00374524FB
MRPEPSSRLASESGHVETPSARGHPNRLKNETLHPHCVMWVESETWSTLSPRESGDILSSSADQTTGLDAVPVAAFASDGAKVSQVPVRISYGIIERFSEGLYSSPTKTFEELITNSYDAGASSVWVYLAADLSDSNANLVVIDDGESMDLAGLTSLWRIGESQKRTATPPPGRKRPVGKFGIGKLATYVLAEQLTYITHRDGNYLAVTMDYRKVSHTDEMLESTELELDVVKLTREAALAAVAASIESSAVSADRVLEALQTKQHWTAAVLSQLKPAAREIKLGRLRWVLRSALPLNPQFALWLDDEELKSSKIDGEVAWSFVVGKDEGQLVKNSDREWGPGEANQTSGRFYLKLPKAGVISGTASLYKQPLQRGRSEELGRSHGFFIRVLGRLINFDDEDFSVGPELRHGTLTRFRMEIDADDLDEQVASARETIKESPGLDELKNYLVAVFNRARSAATEGDEGDVITAISRTGRLSQPSNALSQGPLRRMLQRASADSSLALSLGLDEDAITDVGELLASGSDVVESVLLEARSPDEPMIMYDPGKRAAILNQSHPFISNYIDAKTVAEPMKLFGLSEMLTQAYLLDENVPAEVVARVVARRDVFLRELTLRFPRSASVIAQQLRDATNDENALEDAVGDALELLGFHVDRFGGPKHGTDGIATARLGLRELVGTTSSYAFTYEAKSTKDTVRAALSEESEPVKAAGRIRADTARTSVLKVHRQKATEKHKLDVVPNFTLLVAPDFQGALDTEGLINDVCVNDEITAIRVEDLARLVELFALQGLNAYDLRSLFDARTPEQTRQWVEEQSKTARVPRPPVSALIDSLVKNSERRFPMTFEALAPILVDADPDIDIPQIASLSRALRALAPKSVYVDDRMIALNASPAALYSEIRESLDLFDRDLADAFLNTVPKQGTADASA